MKFGYKVAAVIAVLATSIAVPAAAAQAATEKRVTTLDATVKVVDGGLVVKAGGVARNSVYMLDDTGNQYWSGYGAIEGFDGRASIDAYYDATKDRYVAEMEAALALVAPTARNKVIKTFLDGRLGDDVSWADIAAFKTAYAANGADYLAIDNLPFISSQENATMPWSPVIADLETALEADLVGVTKTEECRDKQGIEICEITFTGNVEANGTDTVVFRAVTNDEGFITRAVIQDGKGRTIARDVFTYNTADVITIPSSAWYLDLATL